jgi:quercetin dioxygenase-like cupin family protein
MLLARVPAPDKKRQGSLMRQTGDSAMIYLEGYIRLQTTSTKERGMRKIFGMLSMAMLIAAKASIGDEVQNLLAAPPYTTAGMGKKIVVDQPHLFMMQAALMPGQMVPQHDANSNVHIMVLDGDVVINLAGKDIPAKKGDLVPIAFKTPMSIKNMSQEKATFVIIKTPNPDQMEQ